MIYNRIPSLSRTAPATLSAGLLLAMSLSNSPALAQSFSGSISPAVAAQPTPPTPTTPPAVHSHSWSSGSSSWSITTSEDGRTIKIESKDGAILAEVDGKAVPADRIVHEGNTVTVKDDKGDVLFEQQVPGDDTSTHVYTFSGSGPHAIALAPLGMSGHGALGQPHDGTLHVQVDVPKVMIGVQLLDPDASIRGHLGLKDDETTMVSGVYEGLPAAAAGLEPYDIIVSIGGKTPAPPATVRKVLREVDVGKSIALEVIHRGQKKTITVTPEKYDGAKIEKAKINAIAAASGETAPAANSVFDKQFAEAWAQQNGGQSQPFVATVPGQPGQPGKSMMLWKNLGGGNSQDLARHMQEMAAQAQEQAQRAQEQAERAHEQAERMLREQMQGQPGLSPFTAPGTPGMVDINRLMEERMKKMEQMMQQLLEHQNAKPAEAPKADGNKS